MSWEERFRKLRNVIKEYETKKAKDKEERDAEIQRAVESFTPPIERVCKAFAKALGGKYSHITKGDVETFFVSGTERRMPDLSVEICPIGGMSTYETSTYYKEKSGIKKDLITAPLRTVVVLHCSSPTPYSGCTEFDRLVDIIPFSEFSEEKLAAVLEDYFKSIYRA